MEAPPRSWCDLSAFSCSHRHGLAAIVLIAAILLQGCSPQSLLLRQAADALAEQGAAQESDLLLARDAAPFYLKSAESVLLRVPGHLRLAEAVTAGFTQYAYAFIAFEADVMDARDAKAARQMRERASAMYGRAFGHAQRALESVKPGLSSPRDDSPMPVEAVPLAYWAAASLAARASTAKEPDVIAELPRAVSIARAAYAASPDHGHGALASLLGSLEASRPGGSPTLAQAYFERALSAGGDRRPGVRVAIAESIALPAGERTEFERLLHEALALPVPANDLDAQVMRRRARWLLDRADDLF